MHLTNRPNAEIPITLDAPPRHISRGFLPWRFAYAGPGVRRATIMGPASANLHKSRHPADGLTLPVLTTHIETQTGNRWFRDRNNLFSPLVLGTGHIAIGYPNDLPNRTSPAS